MVSRWAQVAGRSWPRRYFPTDIQNSRRGVGELGTMVGISRTVSCISTNGQLRRFRDLVPYELAQGIGLVLRSGGQYALGVRGGICARDIDTNTSHGNQADSDDRRGNHRLNQRKSALVLPIFRIRSANFFNHINSHPVLMDPTLTAQIDAYGCCP